MTDRSPHEIINPSELSAPVGFAHAVVAAPGRTVYLGGQTAHDADGNLVGETLAGQFDAAAANVVAALAGAGGRPEHLVSLMIYTTDVATYRASTRELAKAYSRHLGRHYPAIALFEISELYDAAALVELVGIAVVPEQGD